MSRRKGLALLLSGAVLLGLALSGQTRPPAGKKFALLVGVREYDSGKFDSLRFTENDAEDLARVLHKQAGFTVRVLTTGRGEKRKADAPTTANVRKEIDRLLAGKRPVDLVLVALAGHGVEFTTKTRGKVKGKTESYFCPADAQLNDRESMISTDRLYADLEASRAGVKLLLVDACRNDPTIGRAVRIPAVSRGTAALFSCMSGERAFETDKLGNGHGIFFYHVIEGLKGKARNGTGEVTWSSLVEHVTDKVSEDVPKLVGKEAKQTPELRATLKDRPPVLVPAGR
jgi:uncharacterized caspase-like protein